MVRSLPANAGDTGLNPGPGRSHLQLSLSGTATEPVSPEPVLRNKRSHRKEKLEHCN